MNRVTEKPFSKTSQQSCIVVISLKDREVIGTFTKGPCSARGEGRVDVPAGQPQPVPWEGGVGPRGLSILIHYLRHVETKVFVLDGNVRAISPILS